jgi:hypothetical protein
MIMLAVICLAVNAFALTPPWDKKELRRSATAIVVGTIGSPITCRGRMTKSKCGAKGFYAVPMIVNKVVKGRKLLKEGQTLSFHFWYMHYQDHCVGDQGHDPRPGEVGTYYLGRTKQGAWYPLHWSAAEVEKDGSGGLPKCK